MNKKILLSIPLSALLLAGCGNTNNTCDPDFEDCDEKKQVVMEEDKNSNYVFDSSTTNKDSSVNYEIFVRSFYDSNNDGVGDFNGIKEKLLYLQELGVKNLWLMPFNASGSYHGYDVTNYYDVNSDYGTINDFKNLVSEAKKYNIGIMMDLVLNHSSRFNSWFNQSYQDRINNNTSSDSKADWYNWSETKSNDYYTYNSLYYEGKFDSSMPDFNLSSPTLREEIKKIVKYWIDLGVSGFRLDAVLYYYYNVTSANVEFLKWLHDYAKTVDENIEFVGECWSNLSTINDYYSSGIESFFDFSSSVKGSGFDSIIGVGKGIYDTKRFSNLIEAKEGIRKANNPNGYSSYFLSNHDMDRVSKNCYGDYAKSCASLYLLLPGTPYIYYGEEIEMVGERCTSPDDLSDVKRRLPMVWSESDKTGECSFPEKNRLDLNTTEQVSKGVNDMLKTDYSLINHYKKVINVRNKYSFIKNSIYKDLTNQTNISNEHILIYELSLNDDKIIILHNFNSYNVEMDYNLSNKILDSINTSRKIPKLENNKLKVGAYSTVILDVK